MRRACIIALLPLLLARARADDKPDLKTIIDAWKAREKKVESFDFHWWSKCFEDGASNPGVIAEAAGEGKSPEPIPDTTYIIQYRYLMNGQGRARCEVKDREWARNKAEFVPRARVDVFDGKADSMLILGGDLGFPIASISEKARGKAGDLVWMMPLNLVYRPLSKTGSLYDLKKLALLQENANDGLLAIGDGRGKVFVDPAKDFLPVRYNQNHDGRNGVRMEITYSRNSDGSWVPDTWTVELLRPNEKVYTSESAKAVDISVNKPIANSEFELDLSAGAYVNDYTKNEHYILRTDGTRRAIPPGKIDANAFEELLKSESDSK